MSDSIAGMRKSYERGSLHRDDLTDSPIELFLKWFELAKSTHKAECAGEANAMVLATSDACGNPHARTVLLKEVKDAGFVFFTNYASDKGIQIAENPNAALVFWWPELERQVRVEGRVEKIAAAESDAYFLSRPKESQIGAIVSEQSRPVTSARQLEEKRAKLTEYYQENPLTRPQNWGGYTLKPKRLEFWQGRPSRLHDRFSYEKGDKGWEINRLQP